MATKEILVVDDEVGIRELLSEILFDEGYRVHLAENAQQAREFRINKTPDLVLLDIWMPDMDGLSLLKEWVSQELLTMPVIMMSGHGTIETALEKCTIFWKQKGSLAATSSVISMINLPAFSKEWSRRIRQEIKFMLR